MMIFMECGRLGNQLFQYCALRNHKKGALFLIGMHSLKSMFDGVEIAGSSWYGWLFERIISRLGRDRLVSLEKIKIIGLIQEILSPTGSRIVEHRGLISNVFYCEKLSFFQSECLMDESVAGKLRIKKDLLARAEKIVTNFPTSRANTFFVHIRRGDYVNWPTKEAPAVLPCKWYKEQMDRIRSEFLNPFFVVVSDDEPYAEEIFGSDSDVFVSHEGEEIDFVLMTLCFGGGVLSASSFSWWAAYFARRSNCSAYFIAPLYWAGHRQGEWLPEGCKTSWLKYTKVS